MSRSSGFDGPAGPDDGVGAPRGRTRARRPGEPRARRRRGGRSARRSWCCLVIVVVGGIVADVLTDVWWYESVGFRGVFVKELTTKLAIFVAAALLTGGAVAASLVVAYRTRPSTSRSRRPSR